MSYKVKSLIYFVCFLASILTYYSFDKGLGPENKIESMEIAKMNTVDVSSNNYIQVK